MTLRVSKDSHPVPLADHAISDNLQEEPALAWWSPHVNEKQKAVMGEVKSKCFQRTHKCRLWIPKTWKEALETDGENGDHLWEEAIEQEMKNGQVALQTCNGGAVPQLSDVRADTFLQFVNASKV